MLTSKFGVAAVYLTTFLAYTLFHPGLLVILTSVLSYLGMQEFVKLRTSALERQTVTVQFKKRIMTENLDASSSQSVSRVYTEVEAPKEYPIVWTDRFQTNLRCWMCVAFSLISFGLYSTKNLHSVYYQMMSYITATVSLLLFMMIGTALGFFDSGMRIDEEFVKEDLTAMALDFLGIIWIGGGFSIIYGMAQASASFTIILFFSAWIGDFSHNMSNKIMGTLVPYQPANPEKTLEGDVLAIISSAIFAFFFRTLFMPLLGFSSDMFVDKSHFNFAVIAGLTAFFGVMGDLFLSYLKRVANVKNSGDTFYDFGGVLDVFDSVLTASPIMYAGLQTVFA